MSSPKSSSPTSRTLRPREADLGFAHLDLDRQRRRGLAEVVYGPGKSI